MHKGPAFSLVTTAYATGRGPVFQAGQQFQISVDDFLDEAEVEYSNSQVMKDKEIDTYTCFCDVMQLLEERFKYILEKKLSSLQCSYKLSYKHKGKPECKALPTSLPCYLFPVLALFA